MVVLKITNSFVKARVIRTGFVLFVVKKTFNLELNTQNLKLLCHRNTVITEDHGNGSYIIEH